MRRSGKIGTSGRALRTSYANPLLARFHENHFTGVKTRTENYRCERVTSEAVIPRDDDARLVEADVLQQRGDPLGELIVMQHRGLDASALIEEHASRWFGDVAGIRQHFDFEWHLGRLRSVKLLRDLRQLGEIFPEVPQTYWLGTVLEALFELDIARHLDELVIGQVGTGGYEHTMRTIVDRAPPTLRRLEIDPGRRPSFDAWLVPMHFTALEEFACDFLLSVKALQHVATARWPKLHTLEIAMSGSDDTQPVEAGADDAAIAALAPLFEGTHVPALRNLEIWTRSSSQLVRTLARAPIVDRLAVLRIRSRRACDPDALASLVARNPKAQFDQMPLYSMRPY